MHKNATMMLMVTPRTNDLVRFAQISRTRCVQRTTAQKQVTIERTRSANASGTAHVGLVLDTAE